MANLAINDAHALAMILNLQKKFDVTRIRTLRHLQLYSLQTRYISSFIWRYFPKHMAEYFGSIFGYGYIIHGSTNTPIGMDPSHPCDGIVGAVRADPLTAFIKQGMIQCVLYIGFLLLLLPLAARLVSVTFP